MMRQHLILCMICCLLASFVGCTASTQPASSPNAASPAASGTETATASPNVEGSSNGQAKPAESASATEPFKPKLVAALVNYEEFIEQVGKAKGRVVVVDAWSTSCPPCMKEFPNLVALARRWPEDLVCISLNLDYIGLPSKPPESVLPAVDQFLVSKQADPNNLVNLVSKETDETMTQKLGIEALPGILFFDRKGEKHMMLNVANAGADGLTYEGDVVPVAEKLIEQR